jgi:hypothetical protein
VVHLQWRNLTIRLHWNVYRRLANLLARDSMLASAVPLCDGDLCVSVEENSYRVTIGSVEMVIPADQFPTFEDLIVEASEELETVMADDDWQEEPDEGNPAGPTLNPPWQLPEFSPN